MKPIYVVTALLLAATGVARAEFPDQFYTNGKHIDIWLDQGDKKSILWFSSVPAETLHYNQNLVTIYNNQPEWAYYVNLGIKKFVGKYSYTTGKYSWLPPEKRKATLEEIKEADFDPPGDMPTVEQLCPNSGNTNKLIDPPPTAAFPRLRKSQWDSSYYTVQRKRINARLVFNGGQGSYNFTDEGKTFAGNLKNVQYKKLSDGQFLITGTWTLGTFEGQFRFWLSPQNLNQFQGEWAQGGGIEGTWSGSRIRSE